MDRYSIENHIPELENNVEIHPFNKEKYLIQNSLLMYQVYVNIEIIYLLSLIDGRKNIETINKEYLEKYNLSLSNEFIYKLLYNDLAKFGFIKQNEYSIAKRNRASYLKLSFIFLKKQYLEKFIKPFTILFHKSVFYPVLGLMTLYLTLTIVFHFQLITSNTNTLFSENIILYFIAFQFGTFFHEIGHAAACKKHGARNGGIGFGFYIFIPVLFTDVSDVWKLSPKKRIIVNLGGIYFEMILACFILCFYLYNNQIEYLIVPCILILTSLYNLNPLLRYDGYWVLVDLIKTPNLRRKSLNKVKALFKYIFTRDKTYIETISKKEYFLVIYGLISTSYIIILLFTMLILKTNSIINFPFNIYDFVIIHIKDPSKFSFQNLSQFIIPCIFYYLFIRFIIKQIKKRIV
jgi:putative peptide zinc metalloprotease protein